MPLLTTLPQVLNLLTDGGKFVVEELKDVSTQYAEECLRDGRVWESGFYNASLEERVLGRYIIKLRKIL
jgi:hypothetical protein